MDFWASLEHKLYYKETDVTSEEITARLKKCADIIAATDIEMQSIRDVVEEWEMLSPKKNTSVDKIVETVEDFVDIVNK